MKLVSPPTVHNSFSPGLSGISAALPGSIPNDSSRLLAISTIDRAFATGTRGLATVWKVWVAAGGNAGIQPDASSRKWARVTVALTLAGLGVGTVLGTQPDTSDLMIGSGRQFFFDTAVVEWMQHLTRRMHSPEPAAAPILTKDRPWEIRPYFTCASWRVVQDPQDGLFKVWYEDWMIRDQGALARDGKALHNGTSRPSQYLFARSTDGLHWDKAPLGVRTVAGQDTNIVIGGGGPAGSAHAAYVFLDPLESRADRRYKMIFQHRYPDERYGFEIASSPDGIHWSIWPEKPDFGAEGDQLNDVLTLSIDLQGRRYLLNARHPGMNKFSPVSKYPEWSGFIRPYYPGDPYREDKRRIFQTASSDLLHWSKLTPILVPDDKVDNLDDSFYGMTQYESGGMWIGFLNVFHMTDNTLDVQLVYSRNGTDFERFEAGTSWLIRGLPGSWNQYMVNMASPPVAVGDDLLVYFGGSRNHHDWWLVGEKEGLKAPEGYDMKLVDYSLGIARMKKDRYVSLSSNEQREGILATKPLTYNGKRLLINARCRAGGEIRAEIADASGKPLPGFERSASLAFSGDDVAHEMQWKGGGKLPDGGRFTKVHFFIKDADLFTFEFQP